MLNLKNAPLAWPIGIRELVALVFLSFLRFANNLTDSEVIGKPLKMRKCNATNDFMQVKSANDAFFRFNAELPRPRSHISMLGVKY